MKRSEMVNLISSIVLNHDTNFKLSIEESDFLLKKLEDVGVKPPSNVGLRDWFKTSPILSCKKEGSIYKIETENSYYELRPV